MSTARSRVSACCNLGKVVPRWQNITKVRPAGDSPAGTPHYTSTPYLRTPIPCVGQPAGTCGLWVGGTNAPYGDFTGLSDQVIDGIVDDIMPPGTTDTTHRNSDHNYFFKNGDTVNMVMAKRLGGQWAVAQKHWYGCPFLLDADTCNLLPSNAPCATKYRTATFAGTYSETWILQDAGYLSDYSTPATGTTTVVKTGGVTGSRSIGQKTGVLTNSVVVTNGCQATMSTDLFINPSSFAAAYPAPRSYTYVSTGHFAIGANYVQQVTGFVSGSSGTTGASQPSWNTTVGGTTTDGGVIWTNMQSAQATKAGTYTLLSASNSTGTQIGYGGSYGTYFLPDLSTYLTPINYNVTGFDSFYGSFYVSVGADVNTDVHCTTDIPTLNELITNWNNNDLFVGYGSCPQTISSSSITNGTQYSASGKLTGCGTNSTFSATITRDPVTQIYSAVFAIRIYASVSGSDVLVRTIDYTLTITLADAYANTDLVADYNALHQQQDMSDFTLASLRTDEQLANVQLLIYDELPVVRSPLGNYALDQTDYNNPLTDINGNAPWTLAGAAGQKATAVTNPANQLPGSPGWVANPTYSGGAVNWIATFGKIEAADAAASTWEYDGAQTQPVWPSASWTTAVLKTPLWSGNPITHNLAGSDANFWFGFTKKDRYFDGGSSHILWEVLGYGSTPELTLGGTSPIANTALRWMNKQDAQYDPAQYIGSGAPPPAGNYSHGWQRHINGVLTGGKYVEAATNWPAVNYGCPAGAGDGSVGTGRYAIDQQSVCCVTATAGLVFTVKPTTNAVVPVVGTAASPGTATGGLRSNDFVVVEGVGIFKITIVGTPVSGAYAITCVASMDTASPSTPTGWNFTDPQQVNFTDGSNHIGRLRWVNYAVGGVNKTSAPGIFGRAAVTPTFGSGTVTLTTASAQAYLRPDPVNGSISVDIYDATMTLLSAAVSLTRVSDTVFTFSSGSAMPTAAFIVCAGVDWTAALPAWVASTNFTTGQMIYDSAGNLQRCTTGGQSGATAPTWATSGTTTDGTAVWTFVQLAKSGIVANWTFDQRGAAKATGLQPAWLGGTGAGVGDGEKGCLASGYATTQFNFAGNSCPVMVGLVPFYSGTPEETFTSPAPQLFPIPDLTPDDSYGAYSLNRIELTMVNPFWQQPYKPTCSIFNSFAWTEDDGTGQADAPTGSPPKLFYAHRPWVMAAKTIPTGWTLPDVLALTYDTTKVIVDPPFYVYGAAGYITGGIPVGDTSSAGDGSYANIETNWGFQINACATIAANGNFKAAYQKFVSC